MVAVKVGIVVPYSWSFWGAVVEHAELQSAALRRQGHEVMTIMGNDPPGQFTRALHPRHGRAGPLPPDVIPIGRSVIVPANGTLPNIILSPRSFFRVRAALDRERFDMLHLHEPMTPTPCIAALATYTGPMVGTFHASGDLAWMRIAKPVWGFLANSLLTMRGRYRDMTHSYPLMFIFVAVIGYLFGSTQGTVEAFRSMQAIWHLTNFTVGHSHLTMYGFVTFAVWGGIYALLPLATHKSPGRLGIALHFWMALVGSFIYVIALSIGGTIQGLDWLHQRPFIQSVTDMAPYWVWRGAGGLLMFLSHIVFAWNVWRMTSGQTGNAGSPILARTEGAAA